MNSVSPRFAAVEQVSLVGTRGKLEAFAPSHGTKQDDESEVHFTHTHTHTRARARAPDLAL